MQRNRREVPENLKLNELKGRILDLEGIKKGLNLAKEEILRLLLNEEESDVNLALASLIREGKLPSSSVIVDAKTGEIVVHSFGRAEKIRFQGET
jgi:hypothetical protein